MYYTISILLVFFLNFCVKMYLLYPVGMAETIKKRYESKSYLFDKSYIHWMDVIKDIAENRGTRYWIAVLTGPFFKLFYLGWFVLVIIELFT